MGGGDGVFAAPDGVQETSPRPVIPSLVWILRSTKGEGAWTRRLPRMTSSERMGTWTGTVSIRVMRIAELWHGW